MKQPTPLTTDKLQQFVNKYRAELRAMPLSQQLYKIIMTKQTFTDQTLYELTRQLLSAERQANGKQQNLFKRIDQELNIPYMEAKKLEHDGKLSQESFAHLLNPSKKNEKKSPTSELKHRIEKS